MSMPKVDYRQITIQRVLPNLRFRWPELKTWDDNKLAELYEDFSLSADYGNNDEKFPEWFQQENGDGKGT